MQFLIMKFVERQREALNSRFQIPSLPFYRTVRIQRIITACLSSKFFHQTGKSNSFYLLPITFDSDTHAVASQVDF